MSDLFHDQVPVEFVARVLAVMIAAPQHTFQLLTKRHARLRSLLSSSEFWSAVSVEMGRLWRTPPPAPLVGVPPWIWIGVSVEDQKWADIRIPALIDTPAAVRFISAEPLLGPIDLQRTDRHALVDGGLNWVIVGGESGPRARPMHPEWARSLRDQCATAGIPFFFKQWGAWAPLVPGVALGREIHTYPGAVLQRVGKKAAGRVLDGRTWNQFPSNSGRPSSA